MCDWPSIRLMQSTCCEWVRNQHDKVTWEEGEWAGDRVPAESLDHNSFAFSFAFSLAFSLAFRVCIPGSATRGRKSAAGGLERWRASTGHGWSPAQSSGHGRSVGPGSHSVVGCFNKSGTRTCSTGFNTFQPFSTLERTVFMLHLGLLRCIIHHRRQRPCDRGRNQRLWILLPWRSPCAWACLGNCSRILRDTDHHHSSPIHLKML